MEEVKQHKWFKGIDWDAVLQRKLQVCYHCFDLPDIAYSSKNIYIQGVLYTSDLVTYVAKKTGVKSTKLFLCPSVRIC